MQRALDTVLRLSIKDNNRSGDYFKWTWTFHHPGPTAARVWMCTALAAGHTDPQLTPSACGIDSFLFSCIHCICLNLFVFWWVSISWGHGCWVATKYPKPTQKKSQELHVSLGHGAVFLRESQELWVSLGHGAVFLRDRALSGRWNSDMKWHLQQAVGVSAEDPMV